MAWKFHSDSPIYVQIMEELKLMIARGILKPGDRVAPVRELALSAGVNPNTMQKALSELAREGYFYSESTSGRFVAAPPSERTNLHSDISLKHAEAYVNGMHDLGYTKEEMLQYLSSYLDSLTL